MWQTEHGKRQGQRRQGGESDEAGKGMRSKRLGGSGLCGRWSMASGKGQRRQGGESDGGGKAVPGGGCKGAGKAVLYEIKRKNNM